MCFFKKEDIPDYFTRQIFNFVGNLTKLNSDYLEIQNTLLTCLITEDEFIQKEAECRKYLNPTYLEKINNAKFEKWVEIYNFN